MKVLAPLFIVYYSVYSQPLWLSGLSQNYSCALKVLFKFQRSPNFNLIFEKPYLIIHVDIHILTSVIISQVMLHANYRISPKAAKHWLKFLFFNFQQPFVALWLC